MLIIRAHHRPIGIRTSGYGPRKLHFSKILGDSDRCWNLRTTRREVVESRRDEMVVGGQGRWLGEPTEVRLNRHIFNPYIWRGGGWGLAGRGVRYLPVSCASAKWHRGGLYI